MSYMEPYDMSEDYPDFHAVVTIQVCELVDAGWLDLSKPEWAFPRYSDPQHEKLCKKIIDHFYFREIGLVPPGVWKHEFLRKMNEIMPKYIALYRVLDENPNLIGASSEWYKGRIINSEFPQTQLSGSNGDYASSGHDTEYERIRQDDIIELAERLKSYDDVDLMIINEIEPLFSCLYAVNVNAY